MTYWLIGTGGPIDPAHATEATLTPCKQCGRDTPDQPFCTWCGADRASGAEPGARTQRRLYAAHSGEHVNQPSVVTTLLPHLPRHRVHEFRWGLIGGLAVIVALVGGGLIVAAILAAAVLVPSLYLVYLYEAQVYRDEPARVLGTTLAAGVAVGVVVTMVAKALLHVSPVTLTPSAGFILASTVLVPVVQEILKPLPVLWLRRSPKFGETIDGLTFGVAAGLGFAVAETIINFSSVIATEPVRTSSSNWLGLVLSITVMSPLLQGTCTGIVAAVLWKPRRLAQPLFAFGIPLALGAHVVFSVGSQLLLDAGAGRDSVLFMQAAVVGGLLVYTRHLVQSALLDEAKDLGFQIVVCPHCASHVGAAGFCPACGGAVTAGPRLGVSPAGAAGSVAMATEIHQSGPVHPDPATGGAE